MSSAYLVRKPYIRTHALSHTRTQHLRIYSVACFSASLSGSQETHAGLETGFTKEKVQGDTDKRRETEICNNRWGKQRKPNPMPITKAKAFDFITEYSYFNINFLHKESLYIVYCGYKLRTCSHDLLIHCHNLLICSLDLTNHGHTLIELKQGNELANSGHNLLQCGSEL